MRGLGVHESALSVQSPTRVGEAAEDAAVDHLVTHPHDNAAQNGRIDVHLELDIATKIPADRCPQPKNLVPREGDSCAHHSDEPVPAGRRDHGQLLKTVFEISIVALRNRTLDETCRYSLGPAVQQRGHEFPLRGPRGRRIAERQRQFGRPVEDAAEPEQLVLHIVEHAFALCLGEQDLDPELGHGTLEIERPGPPAVSRNLQDVKSRCRDLGIEQAGREVGAG